MYARAKFRVDPSETDFYLGNINGKFWSFNSILASHGTQTKGWWRRQALRMVAKKAGPNATSSAVGSGNLIDPPGLHSELFSFRGGPIAGAIRVRE